MQRSYFQIKQNQLPEARTSTYLYEGQNLTHNKDILLIMEHR